MTIKSLKINGISITYRVLGTGQTVLLLHGWPSKGERWERVARAIARDGFEVIIPDLPGFGESDDPQKPWVSADYADIVESIIGVLNLKNIMLIGHSFGGKVAALIAARHNPAIQRLVLFAAAIHPSHRGIRYYTTYIIAKSGKMLLRIPGLCVLDTLGNKIIARITGMERYRGRDAMKQTLHAVVKEDIRGDLKQINVPTLVLWGERDTATPLGMGKQIERLIPDARLITMPNLGHRAHITNPDRVAAAVLEFIKSSYNSQRA